MSSTTPWHAALPVPTASVGSISTKGLAEIMDDSNQVLGRDYIVVDVRKPEPGQAASFVHPEAINLPAHTLYHTLPAITAVLKSIPKVIFHCNSCGSNTSRGAKSAGWYQDYLDANGEKGSKAYILEGGINAWKADYPDRTKITELQASTS